ncbi:hypothetical protein LUZ60_000165 [Juncus effusus]|nr:hypothetical protein LUZ60_000165 [Juncus effusus]
MEKKKEKTNYFPNEIIFKILLFLPGTSILRFKSVSKQWNSIISTHFFIKSHLKNAINAPIPSNILLCYSNHVSLVDTETWSISNKLFLNRRNEYQSFGGSCNGLVCFYNEYTSSRDVLVINPTTREWITIPKPFVKPQFGEFSYTLGFVPSTNEYKVVWFWMDEGNPNFEIWTLGGSKSWRKVPQFANPNLDFATFYARGIYSNGILVYLGFDQHEKPWLLSIDLKLEKISSVDLINLDPFKKDSNDFILGELNGNIFLTIIPDLISQNEKEIHIIIMDKERKEWVRKLKLIVPRMSYMRPLFINREKILLQDVCNEAGLYYYDLENEEIEKVYMGDYDFCYHAYPHIDSLVSLRGL